MNDETIMSYHAVTIIIIIIIIIFIIIIIIIITTKICIAHVQDGKINRQIESEPHKTVQHSKV